jgi:hypothetical protein
MKRAAFSLAFGASCSPVFDVEGAFFPAWMLCMVVGVALAAVIRAVFARVGIEPHLGPLVIVYPALALLLTLAGWLVLFAP